jgi:ATP-dependent Clp protease ATP-binding subunit ClpC
VLLDEVEKAAPEVFDIFLQVFDEGRISDAHGRRVDARHSVFIMTSNIGTEESSKSMGFAGGPRAKLDYSGYLSRFFRPEFINRLDDVITFGAHTRESLSKILDLQLGDLRERLQEQGLTLRLADDARELILNLGTDADNGARPLRRAIERLLTRPLSARIVEEDYPKGTTVVASSTDEDKVEFTAETPV